MERYPSFEAFWPFYLSQHRNRTCRNLHFIGTSLGIVWLIACLATGHYAWLPIALVFGYAFAWVGHFFFEKNKPATFTYPKWSFVGDFKMLKLFYTGGLDAELAKHGMQ